MWCRFVFIRQKTFFLNSHMFRKKMIIGEATYAAEKWRWKELHPRHK